MLKGAVYLFKNSKQWLNAEPLRELRERGYSGGMFLQSHDESNMLFAPVKIETTKKKYTSKYYISLKYPGAWILINCFQLYSVSADAFNTSEMKFNVLTKYSIHQVFQIFSQSKKNKNELHRMLHELKKKILIGKMNGIAQAIISNLEDDLEDVKKALGYQTKYSKRKERTMYKPVSNKPYQGGSFSPR